MTFIKTSQLWDLLWKILELLFVNTQEFRLKLWNYGYNAHRLQLKYLELAQPFHFIRIEMSQVDYL